MCANPSFPELSKPPHNSALTRRPALLSYILFFCLLCWLEQANAAGISTQGTATLHPLQSALRGDLELSLESPESVYDVRVEAIRGNRTTLLHREDVMAPGTRLPLSLDLAYTHPYPGRYHLLLTIRFRDSRGLDQNLNMAMPYGYLSLGGEAPLPLLTIEGDTLSWADKGSGSEVLGLDITSAPYWQLERPVRYGDRKLQLTQAAGAAPPQGHSYRQYAILNGLGEDGHHYSRLIPWEISSDAVAQDRQKPWSYLNNIAGETLLWLALLLFSGLAAVVLRKHRPRHLQTLFDYSVLAALTLWLAHYLHPELWLLDTWPTGGDLASHVLYAQRFSDWLSEGRISGWMPEVFAGFPAFRFYFPLPFAAIALGSTLVPLQIAIKLAVVGPSLLLPAAAYWLGGRFHWPSGASLFAALFTTGFLIHDGSIVWGGNLYALFAGEFAYSWGLLMLLGFWGTLAWALEHGGRRWIAPALLLVLTALSHGYPLLVAGFSALLAPLFTNRPLVTLTTVLKIHTTAFLLISFWLIPLFEYIPYTIPNDTSVWVKDFSTFVPGSLLPLLIALPALPLVLSKRGAVGSSVAFLLLTALLSATGYFGAWAIGLADIRLFPFVQLTVALSLGAALGTALHRWGQETVNWTVTIAGLLLAHYWLSGMPDIEGRAEWALEGYEKKSMWPHYRALAQNLSGSPGDPRILFEHAPENTDVGSTRAMEALPLFGTRPVLEGLYMEAAFSGPFIYQLQAEVSSRPSSPLARFPAVRGTAKNLAQRLDEFYTDTVVSRSLETAERLNSHPDFHLQSEIGPFSVFRLNRRPQLIELLDESTSVDKENWLESAYESFVLAKASDTDREKVSDAQIEVLEFEDDLLRFRTNRPGVPHRIKMTYHPGWRSEGGEAIDLTFPTFITIVPNTTEVELRFGKTPGQNIGAILSVIGLFFLLLPGFNTGGMKARIHLTALGGTATLFLLVVWLSLYFHPSRNYQLAHGLFLQGNYADAAARFSQSIAVRHVRAQKAEALFWAGRSSQMAGELEPAISYYKKLIDEIPASYWAPESLYRLSQIAAELNHPEQSSQYSMRLTSNFPRNRWSDVWRQKQLEREPLK